MKKNVFIVLLSLFPCFVFSQTAEWLIKPQYDDIQRIQHHLLKVKMDGKVGIINQNGKEVVPVKYDSISYFVEGKALILNKMGNTVVGIVYAAQETFIILGKTYQIDTDFPYFSDGFLAVQNENGKWGFLTENGAEGEGFLSCSNESVLPFSEKITFIKMDAKNHAYINSQGKPLIGNFGKVVEGYSFYNGEALVFNSSFNWAWLDASGNVKKETKAPKQKFLPNKNGKTITHSGSSFIFDHKWRLKEYVLDDGKKDSYVFPDIVLPLEPVHSGQLSVFNNTSGLEIRFDNRPIIPAQFESAAIISEDKVVVSKNRKKGILKIISNQTLEVNLPTQEVVFQHYQNATLQISLNKPVSLRNKQINLSVTDNKSQIIDYKLVVDNQDKNIYETEFIKPATEFDVSTDHFYNVQVDADDIVYYKSTFNVPTVYHSGFEVVCNTPNVEADSNAIAAVVLSVKNISDISSETTTIQVKYDGATLYNKTHTVAAKKSITIPLKITARTSEDYIRKMLSVAVLEENCPVINKTVSVNVKRYIPSE